MKRFAIDAFEAGSWKEFPDDIDWIFDVVEIKEEE